MSREAEDLNRRLLRARDAMDRAYAEPLDVRAVAAVAHISEAHFSRSFRAVFGETPHRYLQRRRVERSMFLLRETDRSVTDICLDVGFTSLGTFSRTFREIVGETPSRYRVGHGPIVAPNCVQMWATRPRASAAGEATADEQFRRSRRGRPLRSMTVVTHDDATAEERHDDQPPARSPRSWSSTRTRRSTSTSTSSAWRSAGLQAGRLPLADGARPRRRRHGDLARAAGFAAPRRGDRRADPRAGHARAPSIGLVFQTDDARALYETLKERGVTDFTQEPTDHFYGTDMGLRDPFGNAIRILERAKVAQKTPA